MATEGDGDWSPQHTAAVIEYVKRTVAKQLARLQTEYIDMYSIHHLPGDLSGTDPRLVTTLETLQELQADGKILHLMHGNSHPAHADANGVQAARPTLPQRQVGVTPKHWQPAAVEVQFSVFLRNLDPLDVSMKDAGTVRQRLDFVDSRTLLGGAADPSVAGCRKNYQQYPLTVALCYGIVRLTCAAPMTHNDERRF